VTGASGGIGRAIAGRLVTEGAHVVGLARHEPALADVVDQALACDLSDSEGVMRAAEKAGPVEVLVNNAGIGWAGSLTAVAPDDAERLIAVNLLAPILLTRALLPGMLERKRGHVVNVASIVGHTGARGEAVYAATKGGLVAFTESLRLELAGTGVGVSVVTPGVVETPFFERRGSPYSRRWPRPLAPDRVAEAVVRAIRLERAEVFVPRWLGAPALLRRMLPGVFRVLAARFS
jgi:short-subunit dehydrogenase